MAINKVIYGGNTLIDLTGDTVSSQTLLTNTTAHAANGALITGTCDFDANTSDATLKASELLNGVTAYGRGNKITGTMPNNGSVTESIESKEEEITIAQGYHDGSGKIKIAEEEQAKIIPSNIKEGVVILGVQGTVEPSSSVTAQSKTVTPTTAKQTIIPDENVDYLSQVIVNAIPYVETANSAGGTTVTIAG